MKRCLVLVVLLLAAPVTAWAGEIVEPAGCQEVAGSYIVVFDPTIREDQADDILESRVEGMAKELADKWGGDVTAVWSHALQGFALASKQESSAQSIADDPRVAYVQRDCVISLNADQVDPPSWGLDRIDQRFLPLDDLFHYESAGAGVHLYIIDTGIRTTHNEFSGRVGNGFSSQPGGVEDCDGHGTHVAGTAAGTTFGVAKQATVHPVRVLDCNGDGTTQTVVSGVDWVTANRQSPAVANMSLGGGGDQAVDDAVRGSIASGITYVVAAGNNGGDACNISPARVEEAITVAASDISDQAYTSTNCGPCVDLVAPGVGITSADIAHDNDVEVRTGTSMASPHVAGVAAVYAGAVGGTPAQIAQAILGATTPNQISGLCAGTPNLLLYSDFVIPSDDPPVAAFTFSCSALTCTFDGTGSTDDNGIASYQWSFGDGTSGSGAVVSHTYASGGTRTVTLTVTDTSGQPDSVSHQVSPCNDSVLPSVQITEPADGAFVWGSLTVRANASDASGIDRVEFRVNSSLRCTDTTAPYTCTIDIDSFNSGNKTLRARAFDTCGNSRQDTVEAFFVSNPLAIIDVPAEGATVEGDSVRIAGWASDPDGIASVGFELDGEPLALTGPVSYGIPRPGVCDAVPLDDPNCPNVGFEAFFDSRLVEDGEHSLQVVAVDNDGRTTRTPTPPRQIVVEQPPQTDPCVPGPNTLCLMGNRFQVEASFVQNSVSTPARVRTGSNLSGYFWFFNSSNLEIGVKVLDGTGVNGHYWVFHGGLTSLEYTLRVTDTQTGDVRTYVKPAGSYCGDPDSAAFPAGEGFAGSLFELADGAAAIATDLAAFPVAGGSAGSLLAKGGTTCTAGPDTLCLLNDRFQVRVQRGGNLQPAIDLTSLTGAFWFFDSGNTEVIVKVLDGTGINGHFWVFLGSLTDQAYTATVTDTVTGEVWTHVNPAGTYCGTADTAAF